MGDGKIECAKDQADESLTSISSCMYVRDVCMYVCMYVCICINVRMYGRVETREAFSLWLCHQHNQVSQKIGKPLFNCDLVSKSVFESID